MIQGKNLEEIDQDSIFESYYDFLKLQAMAKEQDKRINLHEFVKMLKRDLTQKAQDYIFYTGFLLVNKQIDLIEDKDDRKSNNIM